MSTDVRNSRTLRDIMDHLNTPGAADSEESARTNATVPVAAKGLHCWHGTGFTASSLFEGGNMVTQDRCCFCGVTRSARYRRPKGHGGYAPSVPDGYDYPDGVDPVRCPHHQE